MGIVHPVSGHRRHYALTDVVAPCLIGMREVIVRIGEPHRELFRRAVKPVLLEGLGKGEVIIDVVKQTRLTVPPVFHIALAP